MQAKGGNISNRKMFDKPTTRSNQAPNNGLPDRYLVGGYFEDGTTTVKREYILQFARELATKLSSDRQAIKKTQLRKFYDKVKAARDDHERNFIELSDALISICELSPLANQAVTRGNAPKLFSEFIDKNVLYVKDYESLKAFEQHFRAIVCYYPEKK